MTLEESTKNESEYQEFMDLEEVAKYLKVSMSTVYRYINAKDGEHPLPSFKITKGNIIVKRAELDEWIEEYRKI
jgi:excisionase family DNA binding protein